MLAITSKLKNGIISFFWQKMGYFRKKFCKFEKRLYLCTSHRIPYVLKIASKTIKTIQLWQ